MQPGFMIYADDWSNYLSDYNPEEVGEMLKALLGYFLTGEATEFADRGMRQFFRQAAKGIDFDRKRYDDKCLQNAYNRYRGTCKRKNVNPLDFEEWLTTVNDRQQASTTDDESFSITNINNQSPIPISNSQFSIINPQSSISNRQLSEGIQGERQEMTPEEFDRRRTDGIASITGGLQPIGNVLDAFSNQYGR